MPSHTTNRPCSARDMKASSFWGRTRPVSVRAPARSRIAASDYKPYAGTEGAAEVSVCDEDTVEMRELPAPLRSRTVGAFRTRLTEASVFFFGQFNELRLMPGPLFEREQNTLHEHFIEAHRDELFFRAGAQRNPVSRDLDAKSAERATRTRDRRRSLRRVPEWIPPARDVDRQHAA